MNTEPQAVAGILRGAFDETALRAAIEEARGRLAGGRADLALVFLTPPLLPSATDIIEVVQVHGRATLLAGCTGSGVICNAEEVEDGPAAAFALINLPGARLTATHISTVDLEPARPAGWWHARTGLDPQTCRGWLVFADPYSLDAEAWLEQWNDAYSGVATVGGLAGGAAGESQSRLFLNQEVHSEGAIAVGFAGAVELLALVSQGCRPIGRPWTVTAAERNLIQRIGNLPALTVLQETFEELPASDKARASGNIFVGLAVNEYQEEHRRGDFLVRNLLAADPQSGVVAVGARVRVGQTIQFQFRDGATAEEDLSNLLGLARKRLGGRSIAAMCLCSCSGRGAGLFGHPHHDARQLHDGLGPPVPLAGFFCNGEIGPVGGRISLHGYTASAAILVSDASA
jgi:small ligand-binding sensory domain FIST